MKHIAFFDKKKPKKMIACSNRFNEMNDQTVEAAFDSDCDDCRTAVGVAGVKEKLWDGRKIGVNPPLNHVPKPYTNIEPLKEIRKRRDGR